ncbi:unnamed protein product [Camellia sinensis]
MLDIHSKLGHMSSTNWTTCGQDLAKIGANRIEDMNLEFDTLQTEYKELEIILAQNEFKASFRRKHAGRMRVVKQGIRRLEKVMKTISLRTALQLMISEISDIKGFILVLGASPIHP